MTNYREFRYVGPDNILENLPKISGRILVQSSDSVMNWIIQTRQPREYSDLFVATFIVDTSGRLWINDRRSEHVLCAEGKPVLAAGEMAFQVDRSNNLQVVEVTNQSTGYCPDPESWWIVERALNTANIKHPPDFTTKYLFRLCENCGTKNIVKDDWFECGVCQQPLSVDWNFDQ